MKLPASHPNGIGDGPRADRELLERMDRTDAIAAIELYLPAGYLAAVACAQLCLERGVWLRPLGNVLYALPPFLTSQASLEQAADAMEAALTEIL